ncbi:ADP-ribosylglycohydrolase family protein [Aliiglaciecola sp. CAU 1673]|uniref:ADP-ribosylglycohydrolase family protein n=1 Tax=Aliiglaciecola sp. CAU 1673 TaxID=3032595 RepID=UPI0023DB3743|nr:ADP-ribosylglycohydrolase family protein [Aliiglaciecola sp. CAU 1673]MDF2176932.1 ADP-ribosylglycohydrolase family protein [Aliiglaciecola sp. CAU 1673]
MTIANGPNNNAIRRPLMASLLTILVTWEVMSAAHASAPAFCAADKGQQTSIVSRRAYQDKLAGFWLGQSIANWTGLVTEMDKIGGEGPFGRFYTRDDWGKPDKPSIWGQGIPSHLSETIDFVLVPPGEAWGADDDTDIEYMYQHLLHTLKVTRLSPEQIRAGWLTHIYTDAATPYKNQEGKPENYLWVSNQRAFDLMHQQGMLPPDTSAPQNNQHYDMIDAQLSTEIFGLFAPNRPDIALSLAHLPIRTVARDNAAWAAEFYVILHALAASVSAEQPIGPQLQKRAALARGYLPEHSYVAAMYDFVLAAYKQQTPWESVRDELYQRYQVQQQDGYDISSRELYCNGCFAAGINFGASLISLFYGDGDFKETVKLATLMGWDSDNPAATWGGLLGFILGLQKVEQQFEKPVSHQFYIHRTRKNFAKNGMDTFENMGSKGIEIVDRVVVQELGGKLDTERQIWEIPLPPCQALKHK